MKTANYWRTIPKRSLAIFLLGVFFIFSTIGFATDLMDMGRQPMRRLMMLVFLYGLFAVGYAIAGFVLRGQSWKAMIPLLVVQTVVMNLVGGFLPSLPIPTQMSAADIARTHDRLVLSGSANIWAMILGYACFVYVSIAEGRRYFRVHAEIELAGEIHRALVPAVNTRIGDFEFYGRSLPSGEVGGDLIDVFQDERGWVAYIADVSGHGVAPGVVMGMVKSAARMRLSSRDGSAGLLESLNSVLCPITKPEMFVTFAYLAWNGERLEYSLAGHPAILHYRAKTGEISEVSCSNLPLGMFDAQSFVSGSVECAPEDIFLLLTDGLLEVMDKRGEEFGFESIKAAMIAQAKNPPDVMLQAIVDAASRHGHAVDDQSLLFVRRHSRAAA